VDVDQPGVRRVQRLRAKIERDPERPEVVLTVRGVGYKAGPA
jgi:two-component system response regulator MtrA